MVSSSARPSPRAAFFGAVLVLFSVVIAEPRAQNRGPLLTSPKIQFGHEIGDDYFLVNYTQYVDYLLKLDRESDRMTVVDIGKTAEGRTEYTAIITSPENHKKLAQIKEANRRLALADVRATIRRASSPATVKSWSGSMAVCMPPKSWAPSS